MTTEQKQVAEFHKAAGDQDPLVPTMPSLEVRILRAKLMFEECLETIQEGLGVDCFSDIPSDAGLIDYVQRMLSKFTLYWKEVHPGSLEKIADGCADLKYVTYGTELACGIDGSPVFDEVHKSNMTKFLDAQHEHGKKVKKGPSFRPPDIAGVLERQKHAFRPAVKWDEITAALQIEILARKEEILTSFIAKYGCQPNECIMEMGTTKEGRFTWQVRRKNAQELAREARSSEAKIEITEFLENERNTALRLIREGLRGLDAPGQEQRALEPSTEPQWGIWVKNPDVPGKDGWLSGGCAPWFGPLQRALDLAAEKREWFPTISYEVLPFRYF